MAVFILKEKESENFLTKYYKDLKLAFGFKHEKTKE